MLKMVLGATFALARRLFKMPVIASPRATVVREA
jgi:hypothetical protein